MSIYFMSLDYTLSVDFEDVVGLIWLPFGYLMNIWIIEKLIDGYCCLRIYNPIWYYILA